MLNMKHFSLHCRKRVTFHSEKEQAVHKTCSARLMKHSASGPFPDHPLIAEGFMKRPEDRNQSCMVVLSECTRRKVDLDALQKTFYPPLCRGFRP